MRKLLLVSLKIVISGALLYLALRNVNLAAITERINQIKPVWLVIAFCTTLLQIALGALRWRELTGLCGAPLTATQTLRFNMIGAFFNQTLPSSIGGDAVRLWLVSRTGAGWRNATYSVLVDRAIGLIALAIIVVASLPWSLKLIGSHNGRIALGLVDGAALAAGLGFLVFGQLRWKFLQRWMATRDIHACAVIANRAIFSLRTGPIVTLLSFAVHVLNVVIAWCTVRAIGAQAEFAEIFLLIPPIMLITMLPISIAGWGVREATMMVAFGYAGLPRADGLVVSLLYGAVFFLVGAFGGLVWILSGARRSAEAMALEAPPEAH